MKLTVGLSTLSLAGAAVFSAGMLGLQPSMAQAGVIVSDNFSNAPVANGWYGASIDTVGAGLAPSGTNLPGGTWQLEWQGSGSAQEYNLSAAGGTLFGQTYFATGRNNSATAIPISTGTYTAPSSLNISATISPGDDGNGGFTPTPTTPSVAGTESLGFFSVVASASYQYGSPDNFVGLTLDNLGNLAFNVGGTSTAITAAGTGIFDSNGFTTLSYDASLSAGTVTISNILLNGASVAGTYSATGQSATALEYAGWTNSTRAFPIGGMITSFQVSTVAVPEPATLGLMALAGAGLLLIGRKRKSA